MHYILTFTEFTQLSGLRTRKNPRVNTRQRFKLDKYTTSRSSKFTLRLREIRERNLRATVTTQQRIHHQSQSRRRVRGETSGTHFARWHSVSRKSLRTFHAKRPRIVIQRVIECYETSSPSLQENSKNSSGVRSRCGCNTRRMHHDVRSASVLSRLTRTRE